MNQDIRWKQRFENYKKALVQLEEGVNLSREKPISKLEKQGIIKAFEYSYELAWNTMKDYLFFQGDGEIRGSRDAIRGAFKIELIENGEEWMGMIKSRNLTSHTYNEEVANEINSLVITKYLPLFLDFRDKMQILFNKNEEKLF